MLRTQPINKSQIYSSYWRMSNSIDRRRHSKHKYRAIDNLDIEGIYDYLMSQRKARIRKTGTATPAATRNGYSWNKGPFCSAKLWKFIGWWKNRGLWCSVCIFRSFLPTNTDAPEMYNQEGCVSGELPNLLCFSLCTFMFPFFPSLP